MINFDIVAGNIVGLPDADREKFQELMDIYSNNASNNAIKNRYYEGKIPLSEVNLGIALPDTLRGLEIGCSWGAKCVDVLAARSMFDGFVGSEGENIEALDTITLNNNLIAEYMKACRDELKYGCTFATLSADDQINCKIRFHSPKSAAAKWNGEKGRIDCGFAIIDSVPENNPDYTWTPSLINFYTDEYIWVISRKENTNIWEATPNRHQMGRPLMEALIWNATTDKPFGRSRIKEPVRRLIQGYVRTIANATIGLEFSTSPQKYLLGVTDEQYDNLINNKFKQYVGSIIASTTNPETGEKPSFGQLMQGSITPHVEMMKLIATQFSSATGLSISDTGVVNDANPTSAEAITAQNQTLVGMAEQLNTGNGNALRSIAQMALAIVNNTSLDKLTPEQNAVIAHFKNPAMPSVSSTADAAIKIASARQGFADTDIFLEMIGFDKADIRRIKSQERMNMGYQFLKELNGEVTNENQSSELERVRQQTVSSEYNGS